MGSIKLLEGDCRELLKSIETNSIDSVVTDPPSGISFLNKDWDRFKAEGHSELSAFQEFLTGVFTGVFRVLKPGAFGLVWALPRTSHHTAMSLEQAGFEIRDRIVHIFGQGYPKNLDVSKALSTSGNLDQAKNWQGWGTGLKPAVEDWWLIRKPINMTVIQNLVAFGTGAINIEAARASSNRFPSDLILSHSLGCLKINSSYRCDPTCPVGILNSQSGTQVGTGKPSMIVRRTSYSGYQGGNGVGNEYVGYNDTGGASRYFNVFDPEYPAPFRFASKTKGDERKKESNEHPTVKSLSLMKYLVSIVTPCKGTILDPFAGSGSTLIAANAEGFNSIGIEINPEYIETIKSRVAPANEENEAQDLLSRISSED